MRNDANVLLLLRTHTREREKGFSLRRYHDKHLFSRSFKPFLPRTKVPCVPFSRRNETKLVVNERFFVVFFSSNVAKDSKRRKRREKNKNWRYKKKRDLIHSSGRKKDDVLRILDGRGTKRETRKGSRERAFTVVAFVQGGVAEWRRVSRYRGEARDV